LFTVAIIGADGAGKTAVTHRLVQSLALPVKYVYMGVNLETSNLVLPTTRLWLEIRRLRGKRPDMVGPMDPASQKPQPKNWLKRFLSRIKTNLRTSGWIAEEWFRQCVVWYYLRRGFIVIFDRHFFFDYFYYHISHLQGELSIIERLHGFLLRRFYPRPDLVICLDAPAEVLYARKPESSVELLERRRQEYLSLQAEVKKFIRIDASRPMEEVVQDAKDSILDFHHAQTKTRSQSESQLQSDQQGSRK
jgi:thymidylate kinase